jgi:phage/plasmid-like protein (TIGR03299 family)
MPHELATTNGRTAMMYSGDTPWHGLGTKLDEPATAAVAIGKAGLNFGVQLQPLNTADGIAVDQRKAVVRTDTNDVLGVVGNSYQPVQNYQCFGFLDAVVAEGELKYHTAGALGKGERIWMLAKLPGEIRIQDSEDVTEKFLLLHNSHDGTSSLRVFFTPIRVVCANTLAMAETRSRGSSVSIAHKGNLTSKIAEAQEILGFAKRFYDDAEEKINRLASFQPSRQQLEDYFYNLYPDADDTGRFRARNIRQELFRLFEYGRGQEIPETKLTTWSAFNAVTEFVDHHRQTRGQSYYDKSSARLKSAWFGSGAKLKAEAWKQALEMCSFN